MKTSKKGLVTSIIVLLTLWNLKTSAQQDTQINSKETVVGYELVGMKVTD
jgi:hypothetical protein